MPRRDPARHSLAGLQGVAGWLWGGSLALQFTQKVCVYGRAIHQAGKGVIEAITVHGGCMVLLCVWMSAHPCRLCGKEGGKGTAWQQVALQVAGRWPAELLLWRLLLLLLGAAACLQHYASQLLVLR